MKRMRGKKGSSGKERKGEQRKLRTGTNQQERMRGWEKEREAVKANKKEQTSK